MQILAVRQRLPDERKGFSHDFKVGDHEGNVRVGLYEDGTPAEMFIKMSKMGSTVNGLLDVVALFASVALQSGVPLQALCTKVIGKRYEPSGFTSNHEVVKEASSITDYVFRWLEAKFLPGQAAERRERERQEGGLEGEWQKLAS